MLICRTLKVYHGIRSQGTARILSDYLTFHYLVCGKTRTSSILQVWITDRAELNCGCSSQVTRHEISPIFAASGNRTPVGCLPVYKRLSNEPSNPELIVTQKPPSQAAFTLMSGDFSHQSILPRSEKEHSGSCSPD